MDDLLFKLRRKFVNKKKNTKKLKYESLLEENKVKNEEIIKLLYERNELKDKTEDLGKQILLYKNRCQCFEEKINQLEEKNSELLHELESKRTKVKKK